MPPDTRSTNAHERSGPNPHLLDLPTELLTDILKLFDVYSCELIRLRATCRLLNASVLAYCAQRTRQKEHHPFAKLQFGLNPAHLQGADMIPSNKDLRSLPYKIVFEYEDTSGSSNPSRLDFDYIRKGEWKARYGTEWGALQLLLIGIRDAGPDAVDDDAIFESSYRRNRFRETRSLNVHQKKYSRFLNRRRGQQHLKDTLSRFPSLSCLEGGNIGTSFSFDDSLKRSLATYSGMDDEALIRFPELDAAINASEHPEQHCARPCEYEGFKALVRALAGSNIILKDLSLHELDPNALLSREIPALLVEVGVDHLTTVTLQLHSGDAFAENAAPWKLFLGRMTSLQSLFFQGAQALMIDEAEDQADTEDVDKWFTEVLSTPFWPDFNSFRLDLWEVSLKAFDALVTNHHGTLRKLHYQPFSDDADQVTGLLDMLKLWRGLLNLEEATIRLGHKSLAEFELLEHRDEDARRLVAKATRITFTHWEFGGYFLPDAESND